MQEQLLILPVKDCVSCPPPTGSPSPWAKKISCVKWTVAGHGDYMVSNKRCISIGVWEEAMCQWDGSEGEEGQGPSAAFS